MNSRLKKPVLKFPILTGVCLFLGIAAFALWTEHRMHLMGAFAYLLLLACPLIHLFMHGGHGHGAEHQIDEMTGANGRGHGPHHDVRGPQP